MSPRQRRRSNRGGQCGESHARIGRRAQGSYFKAAVEWLEPRCLLSVQPITGIAVPTIRLALANSALGSAVPATGSASPPSPAFSPTQILNAYGFNQVTFAGGVQGNGTGQTIAIIDAYYDPDIAADAAAFSSYYNLSQFGSTNGPTLTITSQTGGSVQSVATDPSGDDWALETSLDVEWAHALAPDANILLVETNSDSLTDLLAGVKYATSQASVSVVSMSWGSPESDVGNEAAFDSYFTTPSGHQGITFVASAGDTGTPGGYPAFSPNVVSVGGTNLQLSAGNYASETVWNDGANQSGIYESTGGGISTKEAEPAYQDAVVPAADSDNGTYLAMPDVAFDADPNTGVAVVDSYDYGSGTGWVQVGGTSYGAPSWAAIFAIADQGRATEGLGTLDGPSQTLPEIYAMPSTNFHDITSGSNGTYSATTGYDLVTGRGTPIVSSVVGYFDAFSVVATTPVAGSSVHGSPTSFTVTFSDAYSTAGLVASDFDVNGVAASSFTDTTSTEITFAFSTSPVLSGQSSQTMTIAAGAILRQVDSSPLVAFSGSFSDDTLAQIAVVSTTPAAGASVPVPMTSLTVQFNEAYETSSISTSNLTLSEGSVTGYTLVNSTTVTYALSGLTASSTLTISIAAGAIDDTNGGGGAAFSGSYYLTSQLASGLASGTPAGSLVYEATTNGTIATKGGSASYTLNIAAGQTITAIVNPGSGSGTLILSELTLQGPGISGSDTVKASTLNQQVILQTVAATGGTYTFTVQGAYPVVTGSFTLEVFLNAAVSTSAIGGASNNQLSAAQNIAASFLATGPTATRAAVVGLTNGLGKGSLTDYYSITLAAGQTVTLGVADQSGASGTINVSLLNSSGTTVAAGTAMTTNVDGAVENFTATTAGTYYVAVTGTKSNITYVLVVTRGADFDLKGNSSLATAQNISGTAGVLGAIVSSAPTDWYSVTLAAGAHLSLQTYTFGGTAASSQTFTDSVQPQIQLYNSSGTLIASGAGSVTQSLIATVSSAGTYFVEVTGGSGSTGEYFLGLSTAPTVSITPISPSPTNTAVSQMQIVFNGPVAGMSLADLSLSLNGGANLLTSNQTLTTTDDKTFTLGNLASLTGANGVYTLTVAANSGITNQNSLPLQTGASTTFTVDTTPPDVTGVYVGSTAWSQTFLNYLASDGIGSSQLGYLIPSGANQLTDLPWVNINTISVVFNEAVTVNTADSALQLLGSPNLPSPQSLASATFTYTAATHTAQWTFSSSLATDKYLLSIPSADVTDSLGSTLSGAWITSSSAYPSGTGVAGSNFNFAFNVLQGDVNQDGAVTGVDGNGVRLLLLQNTTSSSYSPFDDLVGSGTITGIDGSYVRVNLTDTLPATAPSIPGGGSGNVVVAGSSGTVADADVGGSSGAPILALGEVSTASTAATRLAFAASAGAEPLILGASAFKTVAGGSWPSALKLVTAAPTGGKHSTAPAHAAALATVAARAAAAQTAFVEASPVRIPHEQAGSPSGTESNPSPTSQVAIGNSTSAAATHINGLVDPNRDLGRTFKGDSSGVGGSADDSSLKKSLTDLVLEQEFDWFGG